MIQATAARLAPCGARVQHRHVIGRSGQPHSYGVAGLPHAGPRNGGLSLTLAARPENIAVVRQMLSAVGEALHLEDELVDDLRLADRPR